MHKRQNVVLCSAITNEKFIDYRLAQKSRVLNRNLPPSCDRFGMVCGTDCKTKWMCIGNTGQYEPVLTETCPENQTCNNGICNNTPSPRCSAAAKLSFVCTSEGVFPDPIDCRSYHYCIEEQSNYQKYITDHPRICSNHSYNSRTTYCQNYIFDGKCQSDHPVPICVRPGQNDAIAENPTLYYVCSLYENKKNILYPYIYMCPNGYTYTKSYGCVNYPSPTLPIPGSTIISPTSHSDFFTSNGNLRTTSADFSTSNSDLTTTALR